MKAKIKGVWTDARLTDVGYAAEGLLLDEQDIKRLGALDMRQLYAHVMQLKGRVYRVNSKLDMDAARSLDTITLTEPEFTMALDVNGVPLCVMSRVRMRTKAPFNETHGEWVDYEVQKCPGGYRLSYLISEKGSVLPKGYTAGVMTDQLENVDVKQLAFTQVPIKFSNMTIVKGKGDGEGNIDPDDGAARPRSED